MCEARPLPARTGEAALPRRTRPAYLRSRLAGSLAAVAVSADDHDQPLWAEPARPGDTRDARRANGRLLLRRTAGDARGLDPRQPEGRRCPRKGRCPRPEVSSRLA